MKNNYEAPKSIKSLSLAIELYKKGDFKKAGKMFAESVAQDTGELDSIVDVYEAPLRSQSYHDLSLYLGDHRHRFRKDLDEDFAEDAEYTEDLMPKNSEQQIQLLLDDNSYASENDGLELDEEEGSEEEEPEEDLEEGLDDSETEEGEEQEEQEEEESEKPSETKVEKKVKVNKTAKELEEEKQKRIQYENKRIEKEIDELEWEDPNVLPPSISKTPVKIKI